jgi:hypothetical protein
MPRHRKSDMTSADQRVWSDLPVMAMLVEIRANRLRACRASIT